MHAVWRLEVRSKEDLYLFSEHMNEWEVIPTMFNILFKQTWITFYKNGSEIDHARLATEIKKIWPHNILDPWEKINKDLENLPEIFDVKLTDLPIKPPPVRNWYFF